MLIDYKLGQASIVLRLKLRNSSVTTGAGLTGLTSSSTGLIISTIANNESTATAYTVAAGNVETITTLGTFAAPTSGKCRFKEVDATNHPGVYEVQIADARFAVSNAKGILVSVTGATNLAECDALIPLRTVNPYATDFGLTNLDAAVSTRLASGSYSAPPSAATIAAGVWDAATSSITTSGSIGKQLKDNVDAVVSTRLASASYTAPPDATTITASVWSAATRVLTASTNLNDLSTTQVVNAVWDAAISGHLSGGSTGAALAAAGSAGDPWSTALPGSYGAGTAGKIVGDNLNATVSSRAATSALPANFSALAINGSGHVSRVTLCDTITTYTNNTVQTGDAFARLGAPAGASVSADVAAAKADTAAILDDTGSSGVAVATASKTGYALSSAGLDLVVVETGLNARQALALCVSESAGVLSGAATTTVTIKGAGVATTRILATVDSSGNRSAITLTPPA